MAIRKLNKITLLLAALSFSVLATPTLAKEKTKESSAINLQKEQAKWQAEQDAAQLSLIQQRATFLQFESLLKTALKNNQIEQYQQIFLRLIDNLEGYPLQADALVNYFESFAKTVTRDTPYETMQQQREAMESFIRQYPDYFLTQRLKKALFTMLINAEDSQGVVNLAKDYPPKDLAIQIAVLNAELTLNKTLNNSGDKTKNNQLDSQDILARYQTLWLKNASLPNDAQLFAEWYSKGGRSNANIYQKAESLFSQNDAQGLTNLAKELDAIDGAKEDAQVTSDLALYQDLLKTPANLKALAEKPPIIDGNKISNQFAVLQGFSRYLKTLPENMPEPSFAPYAQWAKDWQLSESQVRDWEIAFISRFFDNESPNFQAWRDAEIVKLKADNLIERRLRMAIWQQTDLLGWLNALSEETKQKQEWRYWYAKTIEQSNAADAKKRLTALAKEKGFYPMLANHKLGTPYILDIRIIDSAKVSQDYAPELAEIAELRQLDRLGAAKQRWRFLLERVSPDERLELSHYAGSQNWFDLGVDASIMAKSPDSLYERFPNAYEAYFDMAINDIVYVDGGSEHPSVLIPIFKDSGVTKTFAMAIARQESAWNPMAQSSANARGLMQLLPSTAQKTAENQNFPYNGEADLFKPLNNILLGCAHLSELNSQYPNNRILIASAYNAGASRVEKWLARANGKLAMDEFIASIPFYETRGYVQNVLTYDYYYQILQDEEKPQTFSQAEYDRLY